MIDCESKYPEQKDLIKKQLKWLFRVRKTNMAFSVETILDKNHKGRGRKPVVALEFKLKKVQPKLKKFQLIGLAIPNT